MFTQRCCAVFCQQRLSGQNQHRAWATSDGRIRSAANTVAVTKFTFVSTHRQYITPQVRHNCNGFRHHLLLFYSCFFLKLKKLKKKIHQNIHTNTPTHLHREYLTLLCISYSSNYVVDSVLAVGTLQESS